MVHELSEPPSKTSSQAECLPECPLCGGARAKPSWLGSTIYDGCTYTYLECEGCGSLYCDPMPSGEVLARLYGPEYQSVLADHENGGEREISYVTRHLSAVHQSAPGLFVDYGCGRGRLLQEVSRLGWRTVGVEFDQDVAASVCRETGIEVVGRDEAHRSLRGRVDVLHLGDVIEHLTVIHEQMPTVIDLLAPGGILIAQGPLESNTNLFTFAVWLARKATRARSATMPPYHVLLATAAGQRGLFRRFGLCLRSFEVSEVAWPAPQRIGLRDVGNVRTVGMFTLRLISQFFSRIGPRDWGNRYFYVGQRT